jgi:hypothetical protein
MEQRRLFTLLQKCPTTIMLVRSTVAYNNRLQTFLITDVISIKIIITHAQYKSLYLCIDDLFINYICTYTYIEIHTTMYVILELGLRGVFFPLPHGTSREPLRVRAPHFGEDWLRTSAVYRLQKYITQETCVIQYSS